jgi:signal transduction histidine kinase
MEMNEFNGVVNVKADSLYNKINSQINLLAVENNELSINPTKFNSLGLFIEIINIYHNEEVAKGKSIIIDYSADYGILISDKALLMIVIIGMVENALEASELGDTITLGCKVRRKYIEFWVNNLGFIPEEVQPQIFHKHYSMKSKERGFSTYKMKLLSEKYLNGRVSFESTNLNGTTFRAIYPIILNDLRR